MHIFKSKYYITVLNFLWRQEKMKKSKSKKNILKEAGVLFVATILVLTTVAAVPMAVLRQAHDVGVSEIISPTSGPSQTFIPEVTVKNFGAYTEDGVPVNMAIYEFITDPNNGTLVYEDTIYITNIAPGESLNVVFPDWYASEIGKYQVTACTQLDGDENSSNDCLTKIFYITIEFQGFKVAPLGQANLEIANGNLNVFNMGSSGNDGVWINLEDKDNYFHGEMVKLSDSLPLGAEINRIFTGTIGGGQDQFICSNSMTKVSTDRWELNVSYADTIPVSSLTIQGFLGYNLSFYLTEQYPKPSGQGGGGGGSDPHETWMAMPKFPGFPDQYHICPWMGLDYECVSPSFYWLNDSKFLMDRFIIDSETPSIDSQPTIDITSNSVIVRDIPNITITGLITIENTPPSTPTIIGTPIGTVGKEYKYKLTATDQDNDTIYYFVDWGDNSNMSFYGPYSSSEQATVSHTWTKKGTYTIRTKTMDQNYIDSTWATFKVIMPKTYTYNPFIPRLFERFPNAFMILRHLMGQ
jgi:hypothetical protein